MTNISTLVGSSGGGGQNTVLKARLFTANGTWTKPTNMVGTTVLFTGIGGGSSGITQTPFHGGGGGQYLIDYVLDIGVQTSIAVTIGAGGAASASSAPNPGGVTSFGALISLLGGTNPATSGAAVVGAPGGLAGTVQHLRSGGDTPIGYGGRVIVDNTSRAGGGAGLRLDSTLTGGGSQSGQILPATGYGAGGAGGVSTNAGANGAILIKWWETV